MSEEDYLEDDDGPDDADSELAKEFEEHCKKIQELIRAKVSAAGDLLREAESLADEHGVPFRSGVSFIGNHYIPAGFEDTKWGKLNHDTVNEIAGVWGDYIDDLYYSGGWLHSAVC